MITSLNKNKAQTIIEYCLLFAAIIGVIAVAVSTTIQPSLGRLYNRTADSIDQIDIP